MEVIVNGESRQVPEPATVLELLHFLRLDPERVAVELDGNIVRKADWPARGLAPGARLEIVQFVGGG
jgi:sulfur carrier protein